MAITEGSTLLPTDSAGKSQIGFYDGTSLYLPRIDNPTGKSLKVDLHDTAGTALQQDGLTSHKLLGVSHYGRLALPGDTAVQVAIQVAANHTLLSGSNAIATLDLAAAGAGKGNYIGGLSWAFSAAPTSANPTIAIIDDPSGANTTAWELPVTGSGPFFASFPKARRGTANKVLRIQLSAGGTGIFGYINVDPWTD